jgi:hypothetical protein
MVVWKQGTLRWIPALGFNMRNKHMAFRIGSLHTILRLNVFYTKKNVYIFMFHFWVYFIHNEYDDDDDDDKGEDDDEVTSPRFNSRFELPGFFSIFFNRFLVRHGWFLHVSPLSIKGSGVIELMDYSAIIWIPTIDHYRIKAILIANTRIYKEQTTTRPAEIRSGNRTWHLGNPSNIYSWFSL